MVDCGRELSLARQCQLLDVSRSSQYYAPLGESSGNLALMRWLDELHLAYPFYGSRQMVRHLRREGVVTGRHRVRRLMRLMAMEAIYRKPRTSVANPEHRVYPYLLRDLMIDRADQAWCADITYIPVTNGFFYLVAVMGLGQPPCPVVAAVEHDGQRFLHRRARGGAAYRHAGDIQHGPGFPVYQQRVHRPDTRGWRTRLHGRPRPLSRQHLHREAVAVAEVRVGVPARTVRWTRCRARDRRLVQLLQQCAPALVARRSNAGRCLSGHPGRCGMSHPGSVCAGNATAVAASSRYAAPPLRSGPSGDTATAVAKWLIMTGI